MSFGGRFYPELLGAERFPTSPWQRVSALLLTKKNTTLNHKLRVLVAQTFLSCSGGRNNLIGWGKPQVGGAKELMFLVKFAEAEQTTVKTAGSYYLKGVHSRC